ncbi:MAG TPA: SCP2 sterol-binding domain-containing protein [Thermoplasmata archaeon]|nr:SCP2 sterol-binding domain-containing protein [Thermoplasmata archaeon]
MVMYFTREFFEEIASRLNADPEWAKKAGALTVKLVLTCTDRASAFLLDLRGGRVVASEVAADAPADFKFEGLYDAWVILGTGQKDFQTLVLTGKIKFRGSMPKIMGMLGPLNRITATAQQIPKEF